MTAVSTKNKALSVVEASDLCGVAQSTVRYWIRSQKLSAVRNGKGYQIPVEELVIHLKSTGQQIPSALLKDVQKGPVFRSMKKCWEYLKNSTHGSGCEICTSYQNQLTECFTARQSSRLRCHTLCHECDYYIENYLPRIHFIYQLDLPAAVYKGFFLWGGNSLWAQLCGVQEYDLPGMGIEEFVHPKSLAAVIMRIKKRSIGDELSETSYRVFFKEGATGKREVSIAVYQLTEPEQCFLLMAKPKS